MALALFDITDMDTARRCLHAQHLPAFNAGFMQQAMEEGAGFVACIASRIEDILREQRVPGKDNCVSFERVKLQISQDRVRMHHVKVKVRVLRDGDGNLAVFHAARLLAWFAADDRQAFGQEMKKAA